MLRRVCTDPETKGSTFWHISENRSQNPENQQISNCCKNRTSWWILTKPMPNGSSGIIFFKKNWIFNFPEKYDPRPSIWHKFHQNPSTTAISVFFWNLLISRIFDPIFEDVQKTITFKVGICNYNFFGQKPLNFAPQKDAKKIWGASLFLGCKLKFQNLVHPCTPNKNSTPGKCFNTLNWTHVTKNSRRSWK